MLLLPRLLFEGGDGCCGGQERVMSFVCRVVCRVCGDCEVHTRWMAGACNGGVGPVLEVLHRVRARRAGLCARGRAVQALSDELSVGGSVAIVPDLCAPAKHLYRTFTALCMCRCLRDYWIDRSSFAGWCDGGGPLTIGNVRAVVSLLILSVSLARTGITMTLMMMIMHRRNDWM